MRHSHKTIAIWVLIVLMFYAVWQVIVTPQTSRDAPKFSKLLKDIEDGNVKELKMTAASTEIQVVISGHSHKPMVATREEVLYINPGSAGPRRFKLPVTVGRLRIKGRKVEGEIVDLEGSGRRVYVY